MLKCVETHFLNVSYLMTISNITEQAYWRHVNVHCFFFLIFLSCMHTLSYDHQLSMFCELSKEDLCFSVSLV